MRLSEVRGERVFDVIADIIEPACNIASDQTASALFRRGDRPEGMSGKDYALSKVRECLPSLLRDHKDDVIKILAAVEGSDVDEYRENVTMPTLIKGVYEMMTDEDLLAFLS